MKQENTGTNDIQLYSKGEEIFNMVSHIVGGALAIAALTLCVIMAAVHGNVWGVVSGAIYGASMIILYTMSSLYHGLRPNRAKLVFRVIDHCSIFFLIAGTYTPFTIGSKLRTNYPGLAWTIFGIIWGAAVLGITLNAINLKKFKVFSMICYIAMGWCILIAIRPMIELFPVGCLVFLLTGGMSYTIGAVLYAVSKRKNISFMHSVFHLFVVAGSVLHFFSILFYVM